MHLSDGRQERQFELADGKVSHLCWRRAVSVSSSLCIPEVLFKPQDMLGFEAGPTSRDSRAALGRPEHLS